jgi:hypothetical protein
MKLAAHIEENWGKETAAFTADNKANTLSDAKKKVNEHRNISRERINQKIVDIKNKLGGNKNNPKTPAKS